MTAQPIANERVEAAHEWVVAFGGDTERVRARALGVAVTFDGVLYNAAELSSLLPPSPTPHSSIEALLRAAYDQWGVEMAGRLRGTFALVVTDHAAGRLLAIRDPLGAYPLFVARGRGGRTVVSPSLDRLARHPEVDRTINRAALADHLVHRWPIHTETFYRHIDRVPPGCLLDVDATGARLTRYFDPAPPGQPVRWISEDELDGFDERFETAIARAIGRGRPGIFLSGGLDSISVAAVAADLARRNGTAAPVALSLGFPDPACNEEHIQRSVAASLGLPQELARFYDALPSGALLGETLALTRRSAAPILNTWSPAYTHLSLRGRARGVEVVLTGSGGDEWLSVSPYVMADMMRRGDLAGTARILNAWRRSYRMSPWRVLRGTWWTFGARPLVSLALHRVAGTRWHTSRVERLRRTDRDYVAPDATLLAEQRARAERMLTPADPESFYFQDIRSGLDHPLTSMELEEIFEMGRSVNMRYLHPFWDADVVDLLYRTPPDLLIRRGRSKGLVRETVAKRFPSLGLDRQKKVASTSFFQSVLRREIPGLWQAHGRLEALADLGIVDRARADTMVQHSLQDQSRERLMRVWELLNLDAWVASHS